MSSFEFLMHRAPNISHFRVWGAMCFVLEPRSEHRKDWHARSVVGFFFKLSVSPVGYSIWVPELHGPVVSVNVVFDESIPWSTIVCWKSMLSLLHLKNYLCLNVKSM